MNLKTKYLLTTTMSILSLFVYANSSDSLKEGSEWWNKITPPTKIPHKKSTGPPFGQLSPDKSIIVYSQNESTEKNLRSPNGLFLSSDTEIYTIGVKGGNKLQLTHNDVHDRSPVWSHDGKHIIFISDGRLTRMNSDGTNKVYLNDKRNLEASRPKCSSLGAIAYLSYGDLMVYNGKKFRHVTTTFPNKKRIESAQVKFGWSPNGEKLLFSASELFCLYDMENNQSVVVSFKSLEPKLVRTFTTRIAWHPDSSQAMVDLRPHGLFQHGKAHIFLKSGFIIEGLKKDIHVDIIGDFKGSGTK